MSKTARLEAILEIIHREPIGNQSILVARLRQRGFEATQATVSRDIRQLGLVKVSMPGGGSRYMPAQEASNGGAPTLESLRPLFQSSVSEVDSGSALLVVKTPVGFANAVALAVDAVRSPSIVGTIAGDDTLLVVLRHQSDREPVLRRLRALMD